jgi:integrase
MATVTFNVKSKSKKGNASIYCRFSCGRKLNIKRQTGLYVDPAHWNKKQQKIRDVITIENRDELNSKLAKLKIFVIDEYNLAFSSGSIIDGQWLAFTISKFLERPKGELNRVSVDFRTYLSVYADRWIKEKAPTWKVKANKYMDAKTVVHYELAIGQVKKFEGKNKIRLTGTTEAFFDNFATFLRLQEGYSFKTARRMITRVKFFCARAEAEGLTVNPEYKNRVFVPEDEIEYVEPYLNEDEIFKLANYDFSFDKKLDSIRDIFVIGLWTGLRSQDLLKRLDVTRIKDGFLEIKTQKTKTSVSIPLHPQVKAVLNKYNGELPPKTFEQEFNRCIKTIGQVLEFDDLMTGGVSKMDEKTGKMRKVVGIYKKYELLTSHCCRRSFATNLFGVIPNSDIMKILGWSNEKQMFDYIKKTSRESALKLKKEWEKVNQ